MLSLLNKNRYCYKQFTLPTAAKLHISFLCIYSLLKNIIFIFKAQIRHLLFYSLELIFVKSSSKSIKAGLAFPDFFSWFFSFSFPLRFFTYNETETQELLQSWCDALQLGFYYLRLPRNASWGGRKLCPLSVAWASVPLAVYILLKSTKQRSLEDQRKKMCFHSKVFLGLKDLPVKMLTISPTKMAVMVPTGLKYR